MSADPAIRFPGESREYREARNRLLAAEIELRRTIERVAALRRALPPGGAVPDYVLNVFTREGGEYRHRWASELLFAPGAHGEETHHVDSVWPIWNVLDMTPAGRGTGSDFPALQYDE